ncbi:MAG: hypothetical protein RLZZ511_1947 [Cyanobacteriota bacterium]|jgi:hypothetical protein
MSSQTLLQWLILGLCYLIRQGYYECLRDRINDRRRFGDGDGIVILVALGTASWTAMEMHFAPLTGGTAPSSWLEAMLQGMLQLSIVVPGLLLLLVRGLRIWPGNFLAGVGRGFVSFGLGVALLALFCWLP